MGWRGDILPPVPWDWEADIIRRRLFHERFAYWPAAHLLDYASASLAFADPGAASPRPSGRLEDSGGRESPLRGRAAVHRVTPGYPELRAGPRADVGRRPGAAGLPMVSEPVPRRSGGQAPRRDPRATRGVLRE